MDHCINRVPSFVARQRLTTTLVLVFSLGLAGCIPFEAKFDSSGPSPDPREPIVGRWAGTWLSQSSGARGPARAVVERTSPSTCTIWLEMSGYRNVVASWIEAEDVPVQPAGDGGQHVRAKVPLESLPKQNVWAIAMELDGRATGSSLRIRFRTNDAMRELDHGTIDLARSTSRSPRWASGSRPYSAATTGTSASPAMAKRSTASAWRSGGCGGAACAAAAKRDG